MWRVAGEFFFNFSSCFPRSFLALLQVLSVKRVSLAQVSAGAGSWMLRQVGQIDRVGGNSVGYVTVLGIETTFQR